MIFPFAVPGRVEESISCFFGVLDKANALVEAGRSEEAESCFDYAQQLAGVDRENQLLVDLGRMSLWIEQHRHAEALACADHCLKGYDDLLSSPENGCLKKDLLVQRAFSLMELNRRRAAMSVRSPDMPKASPEIELCITTSDQVRQPARLYEPSSGAGSNTESVTDKLGCSQSGAVTTVCEKSLELATVNRREECL